MPVRFDLPRGNQGNPCRQALQAIGWWRVVWVSPTARHARYAALATGLGSDTALLTAHHRDDQAEILLLQLLRGAGPHGLAAMPASSRLGRGWLLRPFLDTDRAELLAYAHTHRLRWVEDASNADIRFDRNYLCQ